MNDQKIENLLNLALDATEREREKSSILGVGYNPAEKEWELIVKYTGSLARLEELGLNISVVELTNEYAIINIPEIYIDILASQPEIEYIEKPKNLIFAVEQGRSASCINSVQIPPFNLFGEGVLVAVIDSGVDYSHPDFRNEDGTTRIVEIWDQTVAGNPPPPYKIGSVYTSEQINLALEQTTGEAMYRIVPSRDINGHGTGVLGIAAGNGRGSRGQQRGVASRSDILVVKLGLPGVNSFPRTTELMQAIDYVIRKAIERQQPISINLSFGNTYGSHDGSSLLETFIDDISNLWKTTICVGSGNEANAAGHTSGVLTVADGVQDVELGIGENELSINIQIWKSYVDMVDIAIVHPSGKVAGPFQELLGTQRFVIEQTEILVYYGEPSPYNLAQEIFIDLIPADTYIDSGVWRIRLVPKKIVLGEFDMWLPSSGSLNLGTRFYRPTAETTLTIPATANKVITVGAYDSRLLTYASFSGRGYTREYNQVKPDIVAPGVNIMTTTPGGSYSTMTGTSFAAPFVTGGAALLMQYGIVQGRDPYLYGEKMKAALRRGARPLQINLTYPNNMLGYGALCVRDSIY